MERHRLLQTAISRDASGLSPTNFSLSCVGLTGLNSWKALNNSRQTKVRRTIFEEDASGRNSNNSGNTPRQPGDGAEHGAATPINPRRVAHRPEARRRNSDRSRLRHRLPPPRNGE